MKKKLLTAILTISTALCCSLGFVACGGNEESGNGTETHDQHTWSSTYTEDGDRHYQTCDGCNEKNYSAHDYGTAGVCVCGKQKPVTTVAVTEITLNKTTLTLDIGSEETLTVTVKPENATDKAVSWSSDKPNIAKVENGKVTAVAEGSAKVTATTGEISATCTVTVNKAVVAVTEVKLNKSTVTIDIGDTETLTATVKPDDATNKTVSWSSDKPNIAKVENGKITAVAEGTATITATADGKSVTCTVTVTAPLTNAEIKAYLDKNYVDGILKKTFVGGGIIDKDNVANANWYLVKDTDGNITGVEYAYTYYRGEIYGYWFSIGKVEFATPVSEKDIRKGNSFNATYSNVYAVSFNQSIQETRTDLTNAICDKVFGENETATRYIVDNGSTGTDIKLGEARRFKVVQVAGSGVKEISINIRNALTDDDLIANLFNETNYRTYDKKSYDIIGTKLIVEVD